MTINPEAAQQISLALHELATNAQKYGLSTTETVHVEVSWGVKNSEFQLDWREYGNDRITSEVGFKSEGFGTKLLTKIVPAMLRGHATRTIEDGEILYRLTAPLEAVAASEKSGESGSLAARIIDENFGLVSP